MVTLANAQASLTCKSIFFRIYLLYRSASFPSRAFFGKLRREIFCVQITARSIGQRVFVFAGLSDLRLPGRQARTAIVYRGLSCLLRAEP